MLTKQTIEKVIWVDVVSPTQDEVRELIETYHVPADLAEEIVVPGIKPLFDRYENCIHFVLFFPASKHTHTEKPNQQVNFIVGKDFIVTVRYDTIDPLHKIAKVLEVESILGNKRFGQNAGIIMYFLLIKLYKAVQHEIEFLSDSLSTTEERMFAGKEKESVAEISQASKTLLNFKQNLVQHGEILDDLFSHGIKLWGEEMTTPLQAIIREYHRVLRQTENFIDIAREVRETNNSLLTTKQNEVMKILTIMAFVTFPLSLIAGIFGMNVEHMPIVGGPHDFEIIVGFMSVATILFFISFKYKKWL